MHLYRPAVSFKNKTRVVRPESERLRFENTHEPLVDRQTWEIVQDIRKHKKRRANMEEQNIFSGLIYCADCGGTMVLHRDIPELTAEILHTFIRRVEVDERAEKYSRTAPQEVKIYYRDVGLVDDLPQSESKPEKAEKKNDSSTNEVA